MLAESIFKSSILSWRINRSLQSRIEILLQNTQPFTAQNYNLGTPQFRTVSLEHAKLNMTYYGFLINYYISIDENSIPYDSSDDILNKFANESIKDIWVNGIRWGIDATVLEIILEESAAQKFTGKERCSQCGDTLTYETLIREGMCKQCQQRAMMRKTFYTCNASQKIYVAKTAWYETKENMIRTDSHVIIRDTYGKHPKREILLGHIYKGEELVEIKFN